MKKHERKNNGKEDTRQLGTINKEYITMRSYDTKYKKLGVLDGKQVESKKINEIKKSEQENRNRTKR